MSRTYFIRIEGIPPYERKNILENATDKINRPQFPKVLGPSDLRR